MILNLRLKPIYNNMIYHNTDFKILSFPEMYYFIASLELLISHVYKVCILEKLTKLVLNLQSL